MPTLVDHQIEQLVGVGDLIFPFDTKQLNPASYDVKVGKYVLIEKPDGAWQTLMTPYNLMPGEFILSSIQETIHLPDNLEAQFQLKSSRAREGYEHLNSGYIDPGYSGKITLELLNVNRYRSLPIEENMLIGQLRFMTTADFCRKPYSQTGHYLGDFTVTPSRVDIFGNPILNM